MSANGDIGGIVDISTPVELGAFVRSQRLESGLTQSQLANRAQVSRDWLIRLEHGHHRLEVGKVLTVLRELGFALATTPITSGEAADSILDDLFDQLRDEED